MKQTSSQPSRSGFTLLELLISVTIIATLSGMLVYYWTFSAEKAKVAEIEKTVRTLKDSIDVKTLDDYVKIKKTTTSLFNRPVYELVDTDQHKKTSHFFQAPANDVAIVFVCEPYDSSCSRHTLDNKDYTGALIVYATGNQQSCNLDEAAWQSTNQDASGLPLKLFRHSKSTEAPSKSLQIATQDGSGKSKQSYFCAVPLDGVRFKVEP